MAKGRLKPPSTMSASPQRIMLAPWMTALAADEQAVASVVAKANLPKWPAVISEQLPQS